MSARKRGARGLICALGLVLVATASAISSRTEAFANVEIGDKLANVTLPTLEGKKAPLLRKDRDVNVFLFFRPDQEHSQEVLEEMARCERQLAGKSIYWVAVVSDFYPKEKSRAAVKASKLIAPVLIDAGDALYGKLGVKLQPVIGVADGAFKLRAYLPFTKVNYCVAVEAHIKHTLGELGDDELARVLDPPKATQGGDAAVASRNLKFARMLLKSNKLDKALDKARHAVELDPGSAEAHALVGVILSANGDCAGARPSLLKALSLEPANATALEASKACPE